MANLSTPLSPVTVNVGDGGHAALHTQERDYIESIRQQLGTLTPGGGTAIGTNTTGDFGAVLLDSFSGANDDAKLSAAMAAVGADTYKRTIQLTNRQYAFSAGNIAVYDGFRLAGPRGFSNPEKGTSYMPARCALSMSTPWFLNPLNSDVYSVSFQSLTVTGGSNATFLGQNGGGTWYCLAMRDIFTSGLKTVIGTQATKFLITASVFDGWWEVNNSYNGAFHLGGSDNTLWPAGMLLDSGTAFLTAGGSNGQAHLWCDGLDKTTIGPLYITCEGGWQGIHVSGASVGSTSTNQGRLMFYGLRCEGRNPGASSDGSVIRVDGGRVVIRDSWIAYGMGNPSNTGRNDAGMIHHAGGDLVVDGCIYDRATGIAETVPFVYTSVTGGDCIVQATQRAYRGGAWTGRPRVARPTGSAENRITDATVSLVSV